jgi:hypothetical protein
MAAKLIILTHKIAVRLHLLAESCTICISLSSRPVWKLLDTPSYNEDLLKPVSAAGWSSTACTLGLWIRTPLESWIYVRAFLCCAVLSYADRGLAMGWVPIQGVLQECLKGYTISGVNSEPKGARWFNPRSVQASKHASKQGLWASTWNIFWCAVWMFCIYTAVRVITLG